MRTKLAAAVILVLALLAVAPLSASADCATPYCSPGTPSFGSTDTGQPASDERDAPRGEDCYGDTLCDLDVAEVAPAAHEQVGGPAAAEVLVPAALAEETARVGDLAFTGGDVIGLAAIGAGALALGAVIVRRSKRTRLALA